MGYEYKIVVDLTPQQSLDLQQQLLVQTGFILRSYQEYDYIEFRLPENLDAKWMPNLRVLFKVGGIYICNNNTLDYWSHLETIKIFLKQNHLLFTVLDYAD